MTEITHHSQMSQDLFADYMLNSNEGYFVDVGCYEPKFISNTYMLEQKGFQGLLLPQHQNRVVLTHFQN